MDFKCRKDGSHQFSLSKPANIEGAWAWNGSLKCPYCATTDLEEVIVPVVISQARDLEKARRENREATTHALQLAGQARQKDLAEHPEVSLAPIQGSGRFGGDTIKIKKSLFDSIKERTPDNALLSE